MAKGFYQQLDGRGDSHIHFHCISIFGKISWLIHKSLFVKECRADISIRVWTTRMLEASFQTSDEHKGLNVLTIAFEVFLNAIEKKNCITQEAVWFQIYNVKQLVARS